MASDEAKRRNETKQERIDRKQLLAA